jgi:hypothetical protein
MKPSYLVLNVVLIAAGLFIYHTVVGGQDAGSTPYEQLEGDDLGYLPAERDDSPIVLDSGADGALSRRNAEKIVTLEGLIAILKGRAGEGSDVRTADKPFASTGGSSLPTLSSGDMVDEENPVFDEQTLKSLEVYLDEINRRKTEARNKTRLENELTRLGVDLSDDQRESVVDVTMAFQTKTRDLMRKGWPKDEGGREARKTAVGKLKEEYVASVSLLVPASEAEKITSSRMSRGIGGIGGNNRRSTRRGGGNGGKGRAGK